jgi:HK97 family phage prohead protease
MEKMPNKKDREYRNMTMAVRADETENRTVEGYATTFNEPYVLFEDDDIIYREQVDPKAFDDCDMDDVIMQYDHEGRVFARTKNETLSLNLDDKGLFITANLGGTEIGRNLYEEIRGGYTDKMSFGFVVSDDQELRTEAADGRVDYLRTITGISKLYDVSAVSIPANNGTSIGATTRSLIDGVIDQIQTERSEAAKLELMKQRIKVRAKALGKDE